MVICESCRAVIDNCWRWCPACGVQLADGVRPESWDRDFYSVEWIIETDPAEPVYEFSS